MANTILNFSETLGIVFNYDKKKIYTLILEQNYRYLNYYLTLKKIHMKMNILKIINIKKTIKNWNITIKMGLHFKKKSKI